MEEKKNKTGLIWLIVILIVLVLGLVGYIIYDKDLFNDNETINKNKNTKNTTVLQKNEIMKFPENDDNVDNLILDYNSECKNIKEKECHSIDIYKNYNLESISDTLKIHCDKYDYEIDYRSDKICYNYTMTLDNKINHSYKNKTSFGLDKIELLKTPKYFIIQEQNIVFGNGKIVIYDNVNGNKIKEINNTVTSATIIDENINNDFKKEAFIIKINDNKLYYAYKDKEHNNCDEDNYLHLGYIDLENELKNIEIQKTKAITNHACR